MRMLPPSSMELLLLTGQNVALHHVDCLRPKLHDSADLRLSATHIRSVVTVKMHRASLIATDRAPP